MNFYITSGTFDFLNKMKEKNPNENMVIMQNNENAVLLHETMQKTVFMMPKSYEVIHSIQSLENAGFAVMNYIPLTDEERPIFEFRFKNNHTPLQSQPGFRALRILRPRKGNTYIIITFWEKEEFYKDWKATSTYQNFFNQTDTASTQLQLFSGSSYMKEYFISNE